VVGTSPVRGYHPRTSSVLATPEPYPRRVSSPFLSRPVDAPSLHPAVDPTFVSQGSRASSVKQSGPRNPRGDFGMLRSRGDRQHLVSVPVPAVSRPGFAPGHLPGRWGDFPHAPCVPTGTDRGTGTGLPLPPVLLDSGD